MHVLYFFVIRWMYENPLNVETGKGNVRPYLTHGASCSEVEIDCLTGEHKVRCTKILRHEAFEAM